MRFKIIYGFIGVLLGVLFMITGSNDLSDHDYQLVKQLYEVKSDSIWPELEIEKYPIAIRQGDWEYVFQNDHVDKRRPALPIIAATAYRVEGKVNVFVPSKSEMDSLGHIAEGFVSGQETLLIKSFMLSQKALSDSHYIGIVFHEALHGFQIENHEKLLFNHLPSGFEEQDILILINEIDNSPLLKEKYIQEYELLKKAVEDPEKHLLAYIHLRDQRVMALKEHFSQSEVDQILWLEGYYEKVEGTARYVESKVVLALRDIELYNEYIKGISDYMDGKEKYYRSGMALGILMDTIDPEWKMKVFTKTESLYMQLKGKIQ